MRISDSLALTEFLGDLEIYYRAGFEASHLDQVNGIVGSIQCLSPVGGGFGNGVHIKPFGNFKGD